MDYTWIIWNYIGDWFDHRSEKEIWCELIKQFWIAHNDYMPTDEENMEDLFILPKYQGKGYGSEALHLVENVVK